MKRLLAAVAVVACMLCTGCVELAPADKQAESTSTSSSRKAVEKNPTTSISQTTVIDGQISLSSLAESIMATDDWEPEDDAEDMSITSDS